MKKLYSGIAAMLLVLSVTACGPAADEPSKTETKPTGVNDPTILVDNTVEGYTVAGPSSHAVGGVHIADWGKFDGTKPGKMEATSFAEINKLDATLAQNLVDKKTTALYKLDGLQVATLALAGWTTTYGDEETVIDGAYALKCGTWTHDAENNKDAFAQWIPDPHSPKVISLTPDRYWVTPNYAEEKDEHGYDWTTNPVITSGAGVYTVVLAKFEAPIEEAPYGIGVIRTEEAPEFVPAEFKNWHLTGTINGWKESDTDEKLQFSAEGEITYTFAKDDEFKITKFLSDNTGTWDGALDFSAIESQPDGAFVSADGKANGNLKCAVAGTYTFKVSTENKITITAATVA